MAERMTVNHDVTGSSPVRGAKKSRSKDLLFLASLTWFEVKLHLGALQNFWQSRIEMY